MLDGFLKYLPYRLLREWRHHRQYARHGYVTTYHGQNVTAAAVSGVSDGGSVVKVRERRPAMRPHSRSLFHPDAVEDLIWELLGE